MDNLSQNKIKYIFEDNLDIESENFRECYVNTSENEKMNLMNDIYEDYNCLYVAKNLVNDINFPKIEKMNEEEFIRIISEENFSSDYDYLNSQTRLKKISYLEKNLRLLIPLIYSVVRNYFAKMQDKIKFSFVIYLKNIFDKILSYKDKRLTTMPSNFEHFSEILLFLLNTFYCENFNFNTVTISRRTIFKENMKYTIQNLIQILDKFFPNESKNLFDKIFQDLSNELELNNLKYLEFNSLQNFCDIYESTISIKKRNFYDNQDFNRDLFAFDFILNNFDKIKFNEHVNNSYDDYQNDIELIDNMTNGSNYTFLSNIHYNDPKTNLNIRRRKLEKFKILQIFIKLLTHFIEVKCDSLIKNKEVLEKIFLNNNKLLEMIKLILYIDSDTFDLMKIDSRNENLNFQNLISKDDTKMKISSLKNSIVEVLTKCIKLCCEQIDINSSNKNCPNFRNFCYILTEDVLRKFKDLNKTLNISLIKDINYDDIDFNICINSYVKFLSESLNISKIADIFKSNQIEIFRFVIMPMLKVSIAEKEAFIIDPEEYVKIIYDLTYNFRTNLIKSQGYLLLTRMCKMFEEFTRFVSILCLEILIYLMKKDFPNEIQFNYSFTYLEAPDISAPYTNMIICDDSNIMNSKNLFIEYLNLTFSQEEMIEQSLQVLSTIQEDLFISNRSLYYSVTNTFFNVFNLFLTKVKLSEFVKSKVVTYIYAFIKFQLNLVARERDKPINENINKFNILSNTNEIFNTCYSYLNYLFDVLLNNTKSSNKSLRLLTIQFLNDLMFNKELIKNAPIKTFFKNFIQVNCKKLNILNTWIDNNIDSLDHQIYYFLIHLIEFYYNEIEEIIFSIYQNFLNKVTKEIEKYHKATLFQKSQPSSRMKMKKIPAVSSKIFEYIKCIYSITYNCGKGKNLILDKNIFNKNLECLVLNSCKFFNFDFEEDLIKICLLIIPKITSLNSELQECLIDEYFAVIISFKTILKDYHVDFLISIMKLVINSFSLHHIDDLTKMESMKKINHERINTYKTKVLNFLTEGYNSIDDPMSINEKDFHLTNFMLGFIVIYGYEKIFLPNKIFSFCDCEKILQIIVNRLNTKVNRIYEGPFASKLFLVFHIITIFLIDNYPNEFINEAILGNSLTSHNETNSFRLKFQFLVNQTFFLCGDHSNEKENRISILYSLKLLDIIMKTNFTSSQFEFMKKQVIFTVQQLTFITFKNLNECEREERELEAAFKINSNKFKNDINISNKKLFGLKNTDKFEDFAQELKGTGLEFWKNNVDEINDEENYFNSSNEDDQDDDRCNRMDDDFNLEMSNEDIDLNKDEEDLFMLDLTDDKELELFNLKMTAELYLKRKRLEYSEQKKYDTNKILNILCYSLFENNDDEFSFFFKFLDKLKECNQKFFTRLFETMPTYIIELCSILKSWKRVRISDNASYNNFSGSKPRKIISLKRNFK